MKNVNLPSLYNFNIIVKVFKISAFEDNDETDNGDKVDGNEVELFKLFGCCGAWLIKFWAYKSAKHWQDIIFSHIDRM